MEEKLAAAMQSKTEEATLDDWTMLDSRDVSKPEDEANPMVKRGKSAEATR